MSKFCTECGNKIDGNPKFCPECGNSLIGGVNKQVQLEKPIPPGNIKCPFCGQFFAPHSKKPTSTGGNIVRGAVFLPWGVVSAVKNKPFVKCPHCHMKIPQV